MTTVMLMMGAMVAGLMPEVSLNGPWEFRVDQKNEGVAAEWFRLETAGEWQKIQVPGAWELAAGPKFDGVGWYRRRVHRPVEWKEGRVWLEFHAVATETIVWLDGQKVGSHLGGWTSFRLDVTEALVDGAEHALAVRVDEKPDHTTKGFLPDISTHFGGIWQGVRLVHTGEAWLDPHPLVKADLKANTISVQGEVRWHTLNQRGAWKVTASLLPEESDKVLAQAEHVIGGGGLDPALSLTLSVPQLIPWEPDRPYRYRVCLVLTDAEGRVLDQQTHQVGARTFEVRGRQFFLNDRPLFMRGILHWGYYPELVAHTPDEATMRKEILDMKAMGFNLIKVCLLRFPERFYELCDELGMLVWQEYPVWGRAMKVAGMEELAREYAELFLQDRNHPSVILRDITCENHRAEPAVLKKLYDLAHHMIPGVVIEDSSDTWLTDHQDRADFHDCHPYLDDDEFLASIPPWRAALTKMAPKPFVFGESIDQDTFRAFPYPNLPFTPFPLPPVGGGGERSSGEGGDRGEPWWLPVSYEAQRKFHDRFIQERGQAAWDALTPHSYQHSLASRKFQVEAFRRMPESAGYVMTSLRDIRLTSPGMYTDTGTLKWKPEDWRLFNTDTALLLVTPGDRRECQAGAPFPVRVLVSHYGKTPLASTTLRWHLSLPHPPGKNPSPPGGGEEQFVRLDAGALTEGLVLTLTFPPTDHPQRVRLIAEIINGKDTVARNEWPLWIFPVPDARALAIPRVGCTVPGLLPQASLVDGHQPVPKELTLVVADRLTPALADFVERGGRLLHLAEAGKTWPRADLPFWRETVAVMPTHPALGDFPHEGVIEHQFLGMTQRHMLDIAGFRELVQPVVEVVNCRNMGRGTLVFEARVGAGRLLVSAFPHGGAGNIAGRHLLGQFIRYLSGELLPLSKDMPVEHFRRWALAP